MGNFRYYRPGSLPWGPGKWIAGFIGCAALFYVCEKLDKIEETEEMAAMRNKTYLYFNYHTNVAKHPDRPTFRRIE